MRILIWFLATLIFIPRVMWANLAYLAVSLSPEDESSPIAFLTSISKRKKKSPKFLPIAQQILQLSPPLDSTIEYQPRMKILLATPIHQVKDYAMERWLKNVSKLSYPADFLMVDNSSGMDYMKRVKNYCVKYGIKKYKLIHINFSQGMSINEKSERIEAAQEVIRQYIIAHNYDAWFSWECDQIIPANALDVLIKIMNVGNFMIVAHNSWRRESSDVHNMDMGCTLLKRECLKKHRWQVSGEEILFKERVFQAGGSYANVYGTIKPIFHLDQ